MDNSSLILRYAVEKGIPLILKFIKELAEYEEMLQEVVAAEEDKEIQAYTGMLMKFQSLLMISH